MPTFCVDSHVCHTLSAITSCVKTAARLIVFKNVGDIVFNDVEDNKRTFVLQLRSPYNHQLETARLLHLQSNMNSSMSGNLLACVEDVRDPPKVVLISRTVQHSHHLAESSYNCAASYTVSLLHRAFPF